MAVIGIDVGNQSCFVGAAIGGGIEIITNDVTDRLTPSLVSFRSQDRQIGASARGQVITNYKNTLFAFKNLLGRDFTDPIVQIEKDRLPYTVGQYPNSNHVGICVQYMGEDKWFTPTQIYAMLLRHIAVTAENTLNSKIASAVISVPAHFTDIQRRAVLDAAKLAGLNSQRLINDGNAIALAYGIYKKDLPADDQPPRNVAFVDMGHTSMQISIFAFSNGKANCIMSFSDPLLGGRYFDERLFQHFSEEFNQKCKVDIRENRKSCLKLLTECERLKKLMSSNNTSIPINIECLLDDFDLMSRMDRTQFEDLCQDILTRVESVLTQAMTLSKLRPEELYSIELVGGSSRVPAVIKLIEKVFSKEVSKTLNFDESVSKGCTIQNALLSPSIRVRQFHVVGVIPYDIRLNWTDEETGDKGEMHVFKEGSPSNLSKVLTFHRKSPFMIEAHYNNPAKTFHSNPMISLFTVNNVKPTEDGECSKIKVKFRVDNSGILIIPNVEMIEKKMVEVVEEKEAPVKEREQKPQEQTTEANSQDTQTSPSKPTEPVQPTNKDENMSDPDPPLTEQPAASESMDTTPAATSEANQKSMTPDTDVPAGIESAESTAPVVKMKEIINSIVLPVRTDSRCMAKIDIDKAIEIEGHLISQDFYQAEKANAKNALEEYVYEMREKLETNLGEFIEPLEKEKLRQEIEKIDEWLIDDETQQEPSVYKEHLGRLKGMGDPVEERYRESQSRPVAFDRLGQSLVRYRKFVMESKGGSELYNHIEVEDVEKVMTAVNEKQIWLEEQISVHQKLLPFQNPKVTTTDITTQASQLENLAHPIMSKPKPKPKEEPPKDNAKPQEKQEAASEAKEAPVPTEIKQDAEASPQAAQTDADLD